MLKVRSRRSRGPCATALSDLKEIKLFNNFRHYYHASIIEEDLKAAKAMKENCIRIVKGRANRIGRNWEAVVEYFIDTLTTGAKFWTPSHRTKAMDPRRYTGYTQWVVVIEKKRDLKDSTCQR